MTLLPSIRVLLVVPVVIVGTFTAIGVEKPLGSKPTAVEASPTSYYCEYPKGVGGTNVSTPTICIPFP